MGWRARRSRATPLTLTELAEYEGQAEVVLMATQLDTNYSATQARRVVSEWADFLASGPSPIRKIEFVSRTPKRLFDSLHGQTQLESLMVKWGDYSDLSPLAQMTHLRTLHLRGASSVADVAPLAGLRVQNLAVEGLRQVRDLSPIAGMTAVTELELGGDWMTPRVAKVESFSFLRKMPQLRTLLLHTIAAEDLDYRAVLDLPNLTSVRVMEVRGMTPSMDVLKAETPWRE